MTLHLVKLCVGCASVEELAEWQRERLAEAAAAGRPRELSHHTRQRPRRAGFAPGASSLYWVISGSIRARQPILEVREAQGDDGILRWALILGSALIPTEPRPRRPFQGWRYLAAEESPPDLATGRSTIGDDGLPPCPKMRADLLELRLI